MCILLAEDEVLIRTVTADVLRDAGYEVMEAETAIAGVELIARHPGHFTALITDYAMPGGLSGADLAARMRVTYPAIPMIISTAVLFRAEWPWQAKLRVMLLPKPYLLDDLIRLLTMALAATVVRQTPSIAGQAV